MRKGLDNSDGDGSYSFATREKHRLSVLRDAVLSKVFLLNPFATILGKPQPFVHDRTDYLNRYMMPVFFLLSVSILSATVHSSVGGEAFSCMPSKEITKDEYKHAVDYCMSKNPYYVGPDGKISWSDSQRRASQLCYYYVATFLLMQAFFFWLPSCLWSHASIATGIDLEALLGFAKGVDKKNHARPKLIDTLAAEIDDSLCMRGPQRVMGLRFGRRIGSYVVTLYLLVKLLYIVNVSAQFLLLNAFLGDRYAWWGLEVLESLVTGENWQNSPVFMRRTLCDVPISRLGDLSSDTLQCYVNVDMMNDKAFFFIWWLSAIVAVITALNLISYLYSFFFWPFCCHMREDYVRFLCRSRRHRDAMRSFKKVDEEMVQSFADNCLGNDGVLLFMFIGNQAGFFTAREVMARLFDNYRWRCEHPSKPVPVDIAFKAMDEDDCNAMMPKQKAPEASASNDNDACDQNTSTDNNSGQSDDETKNNDNAGNDTFAHTHFKSAKSDWTPWNRGRGRRGNLGRGFASMLQADFPTSDASDGPKLNTGKVSASKDDDYIWDQGLTNDSSAQISARTDNNWASGLGKNCKDADGNRDFSNEKSCFRTSTLQYKDDPTNMGCFGNGNTLHSSSTALNDDWGRGTIYSNNGWQSDDWATNNYNYDNKSVGSLYAGWKPWKRGKARRGYMWS